MWRGGDSLLRPCLPTRCYSALSAAQFYTELSKIGLNRWWCFASTALRSSHRAWKYWAESDRIRMPICHGNAPVRRVFGRTASVPGPSPGPKFGTLSAHRHAHYSIFPNQLLSRSACHVNNLNDAKSSDDKEPAFCGSSTGSPNIWALNEGFYRSNRNGYSNTILWV